MKSILPQLIYLGLVAIGLGVQLEQHGKPKTGNHNVLLALLGAAVGLSIQYWGGFYDGLLGRL